MGVHSPKKSGARYFPTFCSPCVTNFTATFQATPGERGKTRSNARNGGKTGRINQLVELDGRISYTVENVSA